MFQFVSDTALWSISKKRWIEGPQLPDLVGLEEGCATVMDRTSVVVFGMTELGMYSKLNQNYSHVYLTDNLNNFYIDVCRSPKFTFYCTNKW